VYVVTVRMCNQLCNTALVHDMMTYNLVEHCQHFRRTCCPCRIIVPYPATCHHIPEDVNVRHHYENLRSCLRTYLYVTVWQELLAHCDSDLDIDSCVDNYSKYVVSIDNNNNENVLVSIKSLSILHPYVRFSAKKDRLCCRNSSDTLVL
jgi:hypothetical protein